METRHVVCGASELLPGERKIVEVQGRSIGVFNVDGAFYALRNRCPHKGAPLCRGPLMGLVTSPEPYRYELSREGQILRCPWHGWEFDVTNGQSVYNPHRMRVKKYDVSVEPMDPVGAVEADVTDEDPTIPTYRVSVEREFVILHVER